jgi:hypothetical protein
MRIQDYPKDTIPLRMMALRKENRWGMICLETNIAVMADTKDELHRKMRDAVTIYLGSFSLSELTARRYDRSAPLQYHLLWSVHHWIGRIAPLTDRATTVAYDPRSMNIA